MAHITAKKTLAAAALAAASFTTPAFAQSVDYTRAYEDCRSNTNEQVIGGLIGAVAGGVFGSQVAARGARSEGSALGAVLGGVAGAAIADGANDCDKYREAQQSSAVYTTQPVTTTSAPVYTQPVPVTSTQGYPQTGGTVYTQPQTTPARTVYTSPRIQTTVPAPVYTPPPAPVYTQSAPVYTQPVTTAYAPQPVVHVAHASSNRLAELSRIDRSIEQLEHKCATLTRKQRRRFSHQRALELDYIAQEIAQLRRERSYIKTASRHDRRW